MEPYILSYQQLSLQDLHRVGGKNASLGEMLSRLAEQQIPVPDGFAITAHAFREFLLVNQLNEPLQQLMQEIDRPSYKNLNLVGEKARALINEGMFPEDLAKAIEHAYSGLDAGNDISVAVRSSATAEDLPEASFAGQHDSFLNVRGKPALLNAVRQCFASLYTNRAIKYREDHGFSHAQVALSVGVQKMVRSDLAGSGVIFTLEPESGFRDLIHISSVWGLGENIVQGTVTPDEYLVFKPTLLNGHQPIIQKKLGSKSLTMVYGDGEANALINQPTPIEKQERFVLSNEDVLQLSRWALQIEAHYQKPMDIEWARDGESNQLFIIQARPETVHAGANPHILKEYTLSNKGALLCKGEAIGSTVAIGRARLLASPAEADRLEEGEIVVTNLTSPDWDPLLKKSGGIVTNKGGRTSHASIVARELGVPAIVGCGNATEQIRDGDWITISCCEGKTGYVYQGRAAISLKEHDFSKMPLPGHTKVMLIAGDPEKAFQLSRYPTQGIGLMRLEFVITHSIKVHPMALVRFNELKDEAARAAIAEMTRHYPNRKTYFIDKLSQSVALMAAAFYPREVIVRMSDFKTNEYANLLGGAQFEPREENPMIGFRGASRYYHELYRDGFLLECEAMRVVRDQMGLTNVKLMIPFCRTPEEGRKVVEVMQKAGLEQGVNQLEIYVMAELPANVLRAEAFAEVFDGFSIGSNDLTQLTLGIDRDSDLVSSLFDERDDAARDMIGTMIRRARKLGVPVGLCGQAPSDYPEYAQFLVEQGIDSISFNADALWKGIENIRIAELKEKSPA